MTLSERIQTILTETGAEAVALGRAAGVTKGTVSQWLSGQIKSIKLEYAVGIQDAFGYNALWIVMEKGPKKGATSATPAEATVDPESSAFAGSDFQPLPKGRKIPVVGQAQGGPDGYISIHDYPPDQSDGWITLPSKDPSAYGLRVRGDSMRPRIKSGEFILVEPSFEAQPGDDVVVKFQDGSAVAKELLWIREDEVCLGSINNGVPPMTRPLESVQTIHRIAAIIPRGSPLHQTAN